jgi:hypothetical protein
MNETRETFYERFSKIGVALHSDPLSELTRKNQSRLLVTALLAILFASKSLDLKTIEIGGAEFVPKPEIVVILTAIVCSYFLIIFVLGVIFDLRTGSIIRTPSAIDAQELAGKIHIEFIKRNEDRDRKVSEILAERQRRLKATSELIPVYDDDKKSMENKTSHEKWCKQMEEDREYFKKDGLDELQKEQLQDLTRCVDFHKVAALESVVQSARKFNLIRIAIDIVFPILLGSTAIVVTILMR